MLCRGCGQHRDRVHHSFRAGSADGERVEDEPRGGVAWLHLPLPRDGAGALDLSARRGPASGRRVCAVYEEVLPSARGVFGGGEEGVGFVGRWLCFLPVEF